MISLKQLRNAFREGKCEAEEHQRSLDKIMRDKYDYLVRRDYERVDVKTWLVLQRLGYPTEAERSRRKFESLSKPERAAYWIGQFLSYAFYKI